MGYVSLNLPGGDQRGSVGEEGSSFVCLVAEGRKEGRKQREKCLDGGGEELWNLWNPDITVVFTRILFGLSRPDSMTYIQLIFKFIL